MGVAQHGSLFKQPHTNFEFWEVENSRVRTCKSRGKSSLRLLFDAKHEEPGTEHEALQMLRF